jgi:ankyrin repeat protein
LLLRGVSIHVKDIFGWTILHRVCKNRHIDLIKLLIEIGGDCTVLNGTGKTPLDYL